MIDYNETYERCAYCAVYFNEPMYQVSDAPVLRCCKTCQLSYKPAQLGYVGMRRLPIPWTELFGGIKFGRY